MINALLQLAQTTPKASIASRVIWASLVVVPLLVVAGMVLVYLRRRMLEARSEQQAAASLMEQLREMHGRGEISDAEYEQTRKSMASRLSHVMDTKRAGGLFELPDPKRRISRREMGPIAPAPSPSPLREPERQRDGAPPGYGPDGGSAKPEAPSP
jgi:hypothetical protein